MLRKWKSALAPRLAVFFFFFSTCAAPNTPSPLLLSPLPGNHDGESGLNYKQVADYLLTLPNGLNEPNPNNVNGSGEPIYGNTNFWLGVRMRRAACARALAASR